MTWVIAAATLAPSCLRNSSKAALSLKNLPWNDSDQSLISEICETIIPKTQSPGAKDLNIPEFVLKMLDETFPQTKQKTIQTGFNTFKTWVQAKSGKSFEDLDSKQKEGLLLELDARKPKPSENKSENPSPEDPLLSFYFTLKSQTLFAYTTSQYFMTKEVVYELVPGRYNVHVPIKKQKTV
jgi:hypothetical protein